jgi:hypothetical protein
MGIRVERSGGAEYFEIAVVTPNIKRQDQYALPEDIIPPKDHDLQTKFDHYQELLSQAEPDEFFLELLTEDQVSIRQMMKPYTWDKVPRFTSMAEVIEALP